MSNSSRSNKQDTRKAVSRSLRRNRAPEAYNARSKSHGRAVRKLQRDPLKTKFRREQEKLRGIL